MLPMTVSGRFPAREQLDEERQAAIAQIKQTFILLSADSWLQERFPDDEMRAVSRTLQGCNEKDVEGRRLDLTPGRYVGVAPLMSRRFSTSSKR